MEFAIGAVGVLLLVWAYGGYRNGKAERELDLALHAAIMDARRLLSEEDVANLRQQMRELEDGGNAQVATGNLSRRQADRMIKQGGIQLAIAAIETKRMFGELPDQVLSA